jgi:hypothetical protein
MKRITSLFLILFFAGLIAQTFSNPRPVSAQSGVVVNDLLANKGLCLPGDIESLNSQACLDLGPVARLKELSKVGITFPAQPLPVARPAYNYSYVPYIYAVVSNESVPLYNSVEDIQNSKPSKHLGASRIKYISIIDKISTDKGTFYRTAEEEWISADVVSKVGVTYFQGYLFTENPPLPFGWILTSDTISFVSPDAGAAATDKHYNRYDVFRVYESKTVNDIEWVMIGVNEWIEHKYISRVVPNYTRPEAVTSDRWIEINLYEQVLSVYEKDKIVFATLISTGSYPFLTKPGVFQIYEKLEKDYMAGSFEADRSDFYYLEDVPYIMYYDAKRALHGAYWNNYFGYKGSHGCVNLSTADSHWLFDWANVGDFVYVWDPSGKAPTDPAFYGDGGV